MKSEVFKNDKKLFFLVMTLIGVMAVVFTGIWLSVKSRIPRFYGVFSHMNHAVSSERLWHFDDLENLIS